MQRFNVQAYYRADSSSQNKTKADGLNNYHKIREIGPMGEGVHDEKEYCGTEKNSYPEMKQRMQNDGR